jgi:hypothetical protein
MAAAEKNRLNTISLGLVFYGLLRGELSLRRLVITKTQHD